MKNNNKKTNPNINQFRFKSSFISHDLLLDLILQVLLKPLFSSQVDKYLCRSKTQRCFFVVNCARKKIHFVFEPVSKIFNYPRVKRFVIKINFSKNSSSLK